MYNLGTVFRFEFIRTLKKKSFWIMALSLPMIICVVFGISYLSGQATEKAANETKNQKFSIQVTDESGLINPQIITAVGATIADSKPAAVEQATTGKLDAYFYYPNDLSKNKVEIYAKDVGLFDNGRYQAVAKLLLEQSVSPTVGSGVTAVLQDKLQIDSKIFKDGKQFDGIKELIAPGIFLVLFYFLIAMFGNQMLTSTTEEKENRVTEMILTTIEARTLIIGKILSLILLAIVQIALMLVPVIIAYIFFRGQVSLPNIDLSSIPLNAMRIGLAAGIFTFSFLFFTGILVAVGAVAPTAKEAGGFFSVVMIFLFGPLYAITLFISAPNSLIVRFLTFFPLSAPIPLLLRNAVGNLSLGDSLIGIAILAISAVISLSLAIRLFRYGVLKYSSRVKLNVVFHKK